MGGSIVWTGISPFEVYLFTLKRFHCTMVSLQNGCDINIKDDDGWTALWHAYSNSDEELMMLLLRSGADRDCQNSDGKTVMEDAKENENEDIVELLQKFSRAWTT